jgi:hypothetical protein
MKKYLFIVPIALMAQFISAQALTKNGGVVTESTVSTLKVGTVTYPDTNGTDGQVLTTNGTGTASWTSPSTGGLASVFDGTNLSLDASHSGALIYINSRPNNSLFNNANSLPDGFTCTLIDSNSAESGDSLNITSVYSLFFYNIVTVESGGTTYTYFSGSNNFSIRLGGIVKVNVITVSGQKRIYLTGDLIESI